MTISSGAGGVAVPDGDELYAPLFSSHPVPMMIFDADTFEIVDVNHAAARLYGYTRDEFVRLTIRDIRSSQDIPRLEKAVVRAGPGLHEAGEWRHRLRDGSLVDVRIVTSSIRFRGRPARLMSVQDIRDRTRSEEQLRLLAAALHSAANAIAIMNRGGVIEWINPAFTAMTGYTESEAVGRTARQLLRSGKQQAAFYDDLWRTVLRGHVWRGRLVNRRKDGSLYHEEQVITPVRDTGGRVSHFIAVKEDVTERKRTDDRLRYQGQSLDAVGEAVIATDLKGRHDLSAQRSLDEKLREAQKMEAAGRRAGGLAHDLNNALTAIQGHAQFLIEELPEGELREDARVVLRNAQRAGELTRQWLAFSRRPPGELPPPRGDG